MERDHNDLVKLTGYSDFNSHAHVERDRFRCHSQKCRLNFNSHAHVERDNSTTLNCSNFKISTHTLTWSVTNSVIAFWTITLISTHTLTWSVTYKNFIGEAEKIISTHTLTWSVTVKAVI